MYSLVMLAFLTIPAASFIFFICSLISFCTAKSQNKRSPGSYNVAEIKGRRNILIVSSVIFGVFLTVILAFMILLYSAVAFM